MFDWLHLSLGWVKALAHILQEAGDFAKVSLRIILIVLVAWLVVRVARRAVRLLRQRIASRLDDHEAVKRAETLGRVVHYLMTVVVSLVAGILVLSEIGISVAPILGAAGVVGLAIGFGAQSLVKDYFTGFFLLLEDQVRQGDVVKLGEHAGGVEEMTLRYVRLRDYEGNVHYVPNSTITSVINMSRGFAYAVIDIGVGYSTDIARAMAVMQQVAKDLRQDPEFSRRILDDLEMAGVDRLSDSAIVIRARIKVAILEQFMVRRAYLQRIKQAFDQACIEIPYPQITVHQTHN